MAKVSSIYIYIYILFSFSFFIRNPLKVWASGTTLEGQTPDAYTPPLSRHMVNRKMPQLGVEPKTSGFTISSGTLPYHRDSLGEGSVFNICIATKGELIP